MHIALSCFLPMSHILSTCGFYLTMEFRHDISKSPYRFVDGTNIRYIVWCGRPANPNLCSSFIKPDFKCILAIVLINVFQKFVSRSSYCYPELLLPLFIRRYNRYRKLIFQYHQAKLYLWLFLIKIDQYRFGQRIEMVSSLFK